MHWNSKKARSFMLLCFIAGSIVLTYAFGGYLSSFNNEYNSQYQTNGSEIDDCALCHPGSNTGRLNAYANDFADAGNNYAAIENLDSDDDDSYKDDSYDDDRSGENDSLIRRFHSKMAGMRGIRKENSDEEESRKPKITGKIKELVTIDGYLVDAGQAPADLPVR